MPPLQVTYLCSKEVWELSERYQKCLYKPSLTFNGKLTLSLVENTGNHFSSI